MPRTSSRCLTIPAALLAACTPAPAPDPADGGLAAGETRPAGEPRIISVEGRIGDGVECPVVNTPDGRTFSLSGLPDDYADGDYVAITGEMADASFCMQGEGTLIVDTVRRADPPARDRDPARSGGLAVTRDYVLGRWEAKAVDADCSEPDFAITGNRAGGQLVETSLKGSPRTGYVDIGVTPAFVFDMPMRRLAIETRGPDGLAVVPPESGPLTLGGRRIEGDGRVFVKCAD